MTTRASALTTVKAMRKAKDRIFIAYPDSMLSRAIARQIASHMHEYAEVLQCDQTLDLCCPVSTRDFLRREQPTQVYLPLAAHARDMSTTNLPSNRLHQDLMTGANLVEQSLQAGVKQLLLVGTGCAYPSDTPSPLAEEDLLSGRPASDCETEAIATIALIKLCESYNQDFGSTHGISYRCMLSATPFGPGSPGTTHEQRVIATMIELLHKAKEENAEEVLLPYAPEGRQEFLHADDIAAAALYVMNVDSHRYASVTAPSRSFLNAGYGPDVGYRALAHTVAGIVGYHGRIGFDNAQTAHARSHRLDSHRLQSIGWRPQLDMEDALALTYFDYKAQRQTLPA